MSESKSINRKKDPADVYSAEGLKRAGLEVVQGLSGETWTDYNLHDPGVTILEQLCYALTDLIYRTEFDTADYLCRETGGIDFERQALARPEEIFPSQAVTLNDYRKIIFDSLPEIDHVWVKTGPAQTVSAEGPPVPVHGSSRSSTHGEYFIYLKLNESLEAQVNKTIRREIIEKVKTIYAANRNLCENLAEVAIVAPRYFSLHGEIDMSSSRDLSDILGEIYFKCSCVVTPSIPFRSFEEVFRSETLEELFTGPQTKHVHIAEDAFDEERGSVTISDLIGLISKIEGVRFISSLWFEDEQGNKMDTINDDPALLFVPALRFPEEGEADGIKLLKNGRAYRVSLKEAKEEYDRLYADLQATRGAAPHFADLYTLPAGTFRNFSEYYSIQNHFPVIYGINAFGVPASEPEKRQAQAKQLKAYLLFFEQLIANFLMNIQGISRFFSIDEGLEQSYFSQVLDDKRVPNVAGLYTLPQSQAASKVAEILKRYDPFFDRRGRVLDYLLGLYGEKFSQHALRHYSDYHEGEKLGHELIRNKINFLKRIVEISRMRAGAFNIHELSWNSENIAILEKKVAILLAIPFFKNRSLVDVFIEKGLELLTDTQFKSVKEGTVALEYVDLSDISERIDREFLVLPRRKSNDPDDEKLKREIVCLKNNTLSGSILRNGIFLDRYRVGSTGGQKNVQLVFKPDETSRWEYLASYPTLDDAVRAANDFRDFLIKLNRESEGLHLVEHLLLKPSQGVKDADVPDDFYPFKMSVLFPNWTTRFHDREFQKLAEETVRLNAPAHIYLEFYWLEFSQMNDFEVRYLTWLERLWLKNKMENENALTKLDEAAKRLRDFLLEHRNTRETAV